ncbi:hypothetical protein ACFWMG_25325 [Streptomyces sp. NPDC127074]|uniref:hypothetical protein n=1 Tax=Streptomyces sp. NPDC127074 TaxID=3347130 RepID=UPI003668F7E0
MTRWVTVTLYEGPLDGVETVVDADDPDPWVPLISPGCAHSGGRSIYGPDPVTSRWMRQRDVLREAC